MPDEPPPGVRRRELRTGFSTGTAAAAAAQGALYALLDLPVPATVPAPLPDGRHLPVTLHRHGRLGSRGEASVIKDAGDDPDVTHGAEIGVRVGWLNGAGAEARVDLRGGEGVGRVTRPGLPVAVGEPAVNPVPRRMLRRSLRLVWEALRPGAPLRLAVEVFVPGGEDLARRTLNPRLGILGGISILGTTGLVKPFSHAAYRATILTALKVARAAGLDHVVFSTGGQSEEFMRIRLPHLPETAFVQMGDYVEYALKAAAHLGFAQISVAAFFGKALKMAEGKGHTHASRGLPNLKALGALTLEITGNPVLAVAVAGANTARQALELLLAGGAAAVLHLVGRRMLGALSAFAGPVPRLGAVLFDFDGAVRWEGSR
ncbi:MAG: cobalt-precorrin-5B (C(1))-methyltransferase [Deltaproteobacteria bacterium]|nr:cobalt-precorrin-5B (C(1))-methyltransferase [Deltaproteobacteria bacterium]